MSQVLQYLEYEDRLKVEHINEILAHPGHRSANDLVDWRKYRSRLLQGARVPRDVIESRVIIEPEVINSLTPRTLTNMRMWLRLQNIIEHGSPNVMEVVQAVQDNYTGGLNRFTEDF